LLPYVPRLAPRPATDEELLAVHTPGHLLHLRALAERGGGVIDGETVVAPQSEQIARLAAGGALVALDAVVAGGPDKPSAAFVLARPPGHHAMAACAMGFCLYNSIAVAARYAQQRHGLRRVLVLDWDVHHGNGTQSIFAADPSILFISLHQYPLWPPDWGWLDQVGTGEGTGFTVNVPLPPGQGDAAYALACAQVVRPIARAFQPELVLVSAGQDAHRADPIGDMALSAYGFAALARVAREIAAEAAAYGPVLLLEGGYNPQTLPYLVGAILDALGDMGLHITDPYAADVPVSDETHRRLDMVQQTLRRWWTP
jgi:acetoin utilization deacetylase AcuC-like enzyme